MQTPDANGYVHVQWPSKSIPHGGIFHTRIAEQSAAQQKFLKVLLDEQKLTILQRDKSAWGLRQTEAKATPPADDRPARQQGRWVRPGTSRRRSQSVIRESGAFELDPYRPLKRGEDRELMKNKLAKSMEYGDEPEQPLPPPPPRIAAPKPQLPTHKEKRNELLTQIRERAEWLAEMEVLGHAAPHKDIVEDQIAERLRALDVLGIDSPLGSARSTASGFSTTGAPIECTPAPGIPASGRSKGSAAKSIVSNRSTASQKQNSTRSSVKGSTKKEESVAAYNQIPLVQYTPRARV